MSLRCVHKESIRSEGRATCPMKPISSSPLNLEDSHDYNTLRCGGNKISHCNQSPFEGATKQTFAMDYHQYMHLFGTYSNIYVNIYTNCYYANICLIRSVWEYRVRMITWRSQTRVTFLRNHLMVSGRLSAFIHGYSAQSALFLYLSLYVFKYIRSLICNCQSISSKREVY